MDKDKIIGQLTVERETFREQAAQFSQLIILLKQKKASLANVEITPNGFTYTPPTPKEPAPRVKKRPKKKH